MFRVINRQRFITTLKFRLNSTLVIVEHKEGKIASSTLNAVTAATKIGGPITALIAGETSHIDSVIQSVCKINGISKVIAAKNNAYNHGLPEIHSPLLVATVKSGSFTHVVTAHSAFGKNLLPRAAAILNVSPIADVIEIESENTFKRPIYAGNAIAKVQSNDKIKMLTIRPTAFPPASLEGGSASEESSIEVDIKGQTKWLSEEVTKSNRPELSNASIVISGGRGMKSGDNFKILYELADKLGGTVGASRAAVDAGFVSNDLQIGQTGKIIAPELYVAVGISGAIQHLAGMKDSKIIVAINKDPEAPIFQVADYGLVADLFTAVPELTSKVGN